MAAGGRCAITVGIEKLPPWCAPCWDAALSRSKSQDSFPLLPTMVVPSGTTCALGTRTVSGSVMSTSTGLTCAWTPKHPGSSVTVGEKNVLILKMSGLFIFHN